MACKASRAVINVTANVFVVLPCFALLMAGKAGINRKIARVCVTFGTAVPFAVVFTGIDREKLPVMVKSCRGPGRFGMARFTFSRELCSNVVRIRSLVIVIRMAAIA